VTYSEHMADVKSAVGAARNYFSELYENVVDVRLEEVELTEDKQRWTVTLSGLFPPPPTVDDPAFQSAMSSVFGTPRERVYKTLTVDARTGEVQSMKIRQLG